MMGQAKGNLIKGRLEILIIFLKSIFEHIDQNLLSQRGQLYYKKPHMSDSKACGCFILCTNPREPNQISRKQVVKAVQLLVLTCDVATKDNGIMFVLRGQIHRPH